MTSVLDYYFEKKEEIAQYQKYVQNNWKLISRIDVSYEAADKPADKADKADKPAESKKGTIRDLVNEKQEIIYPKNPYNYADYIARIPCLIKKAILDPEVIKSLVKNNMLATISQMIKSGCCRQKFECDIWIPLEVAQHYPSNQYAPPNGPYYHKTSSVYYSFFPRKFRSQESSDKLVKEFLGFDPSVLKGKGFYITGSIMSALATTDSFSLKMSCETYLNMFYPSKKTVLEDHEHTDIDICTGNNLNESLETLLTCLETAGFERSEFITIPWEGRNRVTVSHPKLIRNIDLFMAHPKMGVNKTIGTFYSGAVQAYYHDGVTYITPNTIMTLMSGYEHCRSGTIDDKPAMVASKFACRGITMANIYKVDPKDHKTVLADRFEVSIEARDVYGIDVSTPNVQNIKKWFEKGLGLWKFVGKYRDDVYSKILEELELVEVPALPARLKKLDLVDPVLFN